MTGILAALVAIATPIVGRVLLALGMSVITVTGVTVTLSAIKTELLAALGAAPVAVVQLVGLGGGWVALGLMLGAVTFTASLWTLTKATRLMFV